MRVRAAKAREASEALSGESAEAEKEAEPRAVATTTEVPEGIHLPPVDTINECYTCHDAETFCNKCHGGVEMPHPVGFKAKHAKIAKKYPKSCETVSRQGQRGLQLLPPRQRDGLGVQQERRRGSSSTPRPFSPRARRPASRATSPRTARTAT